MAMISKPKEKQKKHGKQKKHESVSVSKAKNNGRAKPKPKAKITPKAKSEEPVFGKKRPEVDTVCHVSKMLDEVDQHNIADSELAIAELSILDELEEEEDSEPWAEEVEEEDAEG